MTKGSDLDSNVKQLYVKLAERFCRKVWFSRKIEFLGAIDSMTYRIPHSSKTNFATEPMMVLAQPQFDKADI